MFGRKTIEEDWESVELQNFPDNLDDLAISTISESIQQEVDELPIIREITETLDKLRTKVLEVGGYEATGKGEDLIDETIKRVEARAIRDELNSRQTISNATTEPGTKETINIIRAGHLCGYLGQRGMIMKSKITWKFYIVKDQSCYVYDSPEKYRHGQTHSSVFHFRKCSNVSLLTNSKDNGINITIEGSVKTFIAFSEEEAQLWANTLNSRIALIKYQTSKENIPKTQEEDVRRIQELFKECRYPDKPVEWDLNGIQMDLITLDVLGSLLLSLSNVCSIKLDNCGITDEMLKKSIFCEIMGKVGSVNFFSIRQNSFSTEGAIALSKIFHSKSQIKSLRMDKNRLKHSLQPLLLSLPLQTVPLETLSLSETHIEQHDIEAFCRVKEGHNNTLLLKNPSQEIEMNLLDISNNDLNGSISVLSQNIVKIGIIRLSLENCNCSGDDLCELLKKCVEPNFNKMKALNLSKNKWNKESKEHAMNLILKKPNVVVMGIDDTLLSTEHLNCLRLLNQSGFCHFKD
eukprot:c19705_g2_i2.p1 GENE.c19705_g2_i2~~c19705_g2_i2.p1  ORF type:complete len:526 (+),score=191.89 c19705_g2_i2:24-1580(+)